VKELKMKSTISSFQKARQKGFTIIELIVVIAIIALLSILAIPFARGLIIDGKVQPTANDINKVVTKIRANFAGQGITPYTNLGAPANATAVFSNTARGLASSLTITGTGATTIAAHDLGQTNSLVGVAQATITTAGDSFAVTLPTVNETACPGLASQLSKGAERITINNVVAKAVGGVYNGGTAQNACLTGDANAFVFTFR
jgi:prepilin-type N-terminal cleavage/methylation domain-containing protein